MKRKCASFASGVLSKAFLTRIHACVRKSFSSVMISLANTSHVSHDITCTWFLILHMFYSLYVYLVSIKRKHSFGHSISTCEPIKSQIVNTVYPSPCIPFVTASLIGCRVHKTIRSLPSSSLYWMVQRQL